MIAAGGFDLDQHACKGHTPSPLPVKVMEGRQDASRNDIKHTPFKCDYKPAVAGARAMEWLEVAEMHSALV
jgi:hypothetical protein